MSESSMIDTLSEFWKNETGFLYKIRYRKVDFEQGSDLLKVLKSIDYSNQDSLPRNIVSYIWFIPLFMELQSSSISKGNSDEVFNRYVTLSDKITQEVTRILGDVPEEL